MKRRAGQRQRVVRIAGTNTRAVPVQGPAGWDRTLPMKGRGACGVAAKRENRETQGLSVYVVLPREREGKGGKEMLERSEAHERKGCHIDARTKRSA